MAAVRAEDDVLAAKVGADPRGNRLLADVGVTGAGDQPALVGLGQRLLTAADAHHLAVHGELLFGGRHGHVRRRLGCRFRHIKIAARASLTQGSDCRNRQDEGSVNNGHAYRN